MPLLDHFHPPLSEDVPWEGFHSAWATMIAGGLNRELPAGCRAIPLTSRGPLVEIDVAAVEKVAGAIGGATSWEPGRPGMSAELDWSGRDLFEVRVIDRRAGGRLVGAIELVSPANKDRPSARRSFAGKCAGYLRMGVGLVIVDVVTTRSHDLHLELLELLELDAPAGAVVEPLYAVAYRTEQQEKTRLDVWPHRLRVGGELPTLPLWLSPGVAVPVDLARSYADARELLRVE